MPSGPKKRHAARRRSMGGRPGTRTSLDKASLSDSHASDEGTSPKTSDYVNSRLSLSTGTNERPADQTFQTEEWVRVSDFDVGTPTSTTAKSDFDAQDSFGDVRGHDKLVDWETVSRENAGNSSSAEEVGEADHLAAEDSSGSGREQGQKLPQVDVVPLDSDSSVSEKEDDDKSVSSRSVGGKSSHSSTSSRSTGSRSDPYPKKSDDEERLSSIVVVPSHQEHEDDSQESSYVEVASVEAREDDYHGSVANVSSPEGEEVDNQASSAIEPASSEEQEEDNYELFSGVEDHASSAIEPASSEEQEEDKYRLFTDVSNLKDLLEQEESSGDPITLPNRLDSFSSFISSRVNESATDESEGHHSSEVKDAKIEAPGLMEEEHQTPGHPNTEDDQVTELKEMKPETPEVNESSQEVTDSATSEPYAPSLPEIHPPERNVEGGGSAAEESIHGIEPTTPEKTSEKSFTETPYTFVRSVSDEEIFEGAKASPLHVEQTAPAESLSEAQGVEENIAKEVQDTSFSSGIPEPNQEELNQLIEIAHSKEIANLGKQEEKFLAQEEQDLGKGILEPQPLVEVLSATDHSKPLEGGELKDLQPVVVEEAPLLKDSPSPVDSDLHIIAELKDRVPELFTKVSGEELLEESQGGVGDEHQTAEASLMDDSASTDLSLQTKLPLAGESAEKEQSLEEKAGSDSSLAVDHTHSVESVGLPTENVKGALVPLITITDSEWPKGSAESTKDVEATSESDKVDRTGKIAGSSEKLEQVTYQRREDQPRILGPIQASSDTWGCCEPVQWLFANFTRWVNPPAIRN